MQKHPEDLAATDSDRRDQHKAAVAPATPLPWHLDRYGGVCFDTREYDRVVLSGFALMSGQYRPEPVQNTAYIVHACNHFPALVEALRKCTEQMDRATIFNGNAVCFDAAKNLLRELGELK